MIYLDRIGHLTSDGTLDELHGFAQQIGLKREWFQEGRHPHYDILSLRINRLARKFGAQEATQRESERISRELGERAVLKEIPLTDDERAVLKQDAEIKRRILGAGPAATYVKGETGHICETRWGPEPK